MLSASRHIDTARAIYPLRLASPVEDTLHVHTFTKMTKTQKNSSDYVVLGATEL